MKTLFVAGQVVLVEHSLGDSTLTGAATYHAHHVDTVSQGACGYDHLQRK